MPQEVSRLLVVELLFRAKSAFVDLSHVITSVSQFLDSSVELPLHKACAFESLRLLERIRVSTQAYRKQKRGGNDWSLRKLLLSDRFYRHYQFNQSLQEVVKRKDFNLVKWLSAHFQGVAIVPQVATTAASVGAMEILQFFLDNDNSSHRRQLQSTNPTKQIVVGHRVQWSKDALEVAVLHGHNNVMWWLLQHTPSVRYDKSKAFEYAVKNGDIALAEWLLSHGAALRLQIQGRRLVHEVAAQGRLDVLRWLEKEELVSISCGVVMVAAENGHLDVVRWLLDLNAGRSDKLGGEASLAIHTAAVNGLLDLAKYLRARAETPRNACQCAVESEEQDALIRTLTTQRGESCTAAKVSIDTLIKAGKNGHAGVVKWLSTEYCSVIADGYQQTPTDGALMDGIAARGHLNVLVLVQAMEFNADSRKRNRNGSSRPGRKCTNKAIDCAAANGHLDVAKWLFRNRLEGCTSRAMDGAASGGFLRVVQWLHGELSIWSTKAAMDGAATNGHLEVVKWLHANMNAGCTTQALNGAATNGHLHVVKWLHKYRREGCTVAAMDEAAANGHLAVVKWLHRNRAEGCTTAAMDQAALQGHFSVVQWLHTHRSEGCTSSAINSAANRGNFELLLFLHSQCKQPCTTETMELAARNKDTGGYAWILDRYPQFRIPPQV